MSIFDDIPVQIHAAAATGAAVLKKLERVGVEARIRAFFFFLAAVRARVVNVRAVESRRFQRGLLSCVGVVAWRPKSSTVASPLQFHGGPKTKGRTPPLGELPERLARFLFMVTGAVPGCYVIFQSRVTG